MKHFPESDETQKGHMKQIQQGLQSTKPTPTSPPSTPTPGTKHQDVYLRVYDATKKTMYTDQTGRFPIISRRGHKYVMVAVKLDGNYIDAECMKSCKTDSGAYPLQHQPASSATMRSTVSTTSTTSSQPHTQFDTSTLHSVSPPKTPYLQQFETAISPRFLDSLQPTS